MKEKTKKWIKVITYLLPFVWLLLRNFIPTFMQFATVDHQGYFLLFILFGLCISLVIFPNFEMFCNLFSGNPKDKKFIHGSKFLMVFSMAVYILWMIYSVSVFNVFAFWTNNFAQVVFLFSLTWYLWFSFGMCFVRYVDIKNYEEKESLLVEEE
ncbi:MAG: hypothetical protein MJ246_01070 [Clostridia bacterium]|nr:hypothetical protein [Clostridia bacterium]